MRRAQRGSIRSCGGVIARITFASAAILGLLAALSSAPAQDAGVSGIPPGPANARGLNGSISNPSGNSNASSVQPMPSVPPPASPAMAPVVPSSVSPPVANGGLPVVRRPIRTRRTRFAAPRLRGAAARAAVSEQDRLIDRKLTSICRGC